MSTPPHRLTRPITEADVAVVVKMVHELALYEHAPEQCQLTTKQLRTALFSEGAALFGHVAEADGVVVGVALWFRNFSTWDGVHGIHLEDLYIRPEHRGVGLGRALLAELAAECTRRGYSRFQWSVLDWNESAAGFYRSVGAQRQEGWDIYRVDGAALAALAEYY